MYKMSPKIYVFIFTPGLEIYKILFCPNLPRFALYLVWLPQMGGKIVIITWMLKEKDRERDFPPP